MCHAVCGGIKSGYNILILILAVIHLYHDKITHFTLHVCYRQGHGNANRARPRINTQFAHAMLLAAWLRFGVGRTNKQSFDVVIEQRNL